MKVMRKAEGNAAQWTGKNNIEFINWLKNTGLDWQYDSERNEFWVSDHDDSYFSSQIVMGNYIVVEFSDELDKHVITVYSAHGWDKQTTWEFDDEQV